LRPLASIEISTVAAGFPVLDDKTVDRHLLSAFAPLHRSALAIACGVVSGALLLGATVISILRGLFPAPNLNLLAQFFWGYSVTWQGAFVGFIWGWAVGFVLGYAFALARNTAIWLWLTVIRSRAEMDQYSDFLDHL
jgi:hypothetical protein